MATLSTKPRAHVTPPAACSGRSPAAGRYGPSWSCWGSKGASPLASPCRGSRVAWPQRVGWLFIYEYTCARGPLWVRGYWILYSDIKWNTKYFGASGLTLGLPLKAYPGVGPLARSAAVCSKSFVFSSLPIGKVLVLPFAGGVSPSLGCFLFSELSTVVVAPTTCSLLLVLYYL